MKLPQKVEAPIGVRFIESASRAQAQPRTSSPVRRSCLCAGNLAVRLGPIWIHFTEVVAIAAVFLRMNQVGPCVTRDRDKTYSDGVDRTLEATGLTVLKTPVRVPHANIICERLLGTTRRECLDFLIPFNERHFCAILRESICPYNHGWPSGVKSDLRSCGVQPVRHDRESRPVG